MNSSVSSGVSHGAHATRRKRKAIEVRIRLSRHGLSLTVFRMRAAGRSKRFAAERDPSTEITRAQVNICGGQQIRPDKVNSRQTNGAARRGTGLGVRRGTKAVYARVPAISCELELIGGRTVERIESIGWPASAHASIRSSQRSTSDRSGLSPDHVGGPSGSQDNFHR